MENPSQPVQPAPRRRRRARFLLGGLVVVLLLVAFAPFLLSAVARPRLESMLGRKLRGAVTIDRVAAGWFSGIEVEGVRVTPSRPGRPAISIRRITANPALLAGLGGSAVI